MKLSDLKPGDKVLRLLSSDRIPMWMTVVKVEDGLIYCDSHPPGAILDGQFWTFDQETGAEEDPELEWGMAFGRTGSVLTLERLQ